MCEKLWLEMKFKENLLKSDSADTVYLTHEYAKSQVKVLTCKTLLKPLWVSGLLWSLIAHGLLLEFLMLTNYSSWEITNAPPNIIPNNALHKDLYTSI